MKNKNQNIEFKNIWKDEYLKWVCGFANAKGGTLFIGVDNSGEVIGVNNFKKLLKDLPNKTSDILGIMVECWFTKTIFQKNGTRISNSF